jgi:hypothetical protein
MKTKPSKKAMTFGELIATFDHTYGKRKGQGILRLLIQAELIGFEGRNRYVVSRGNGKA